MRLKIETDDFETIARNVSPATAAAIVGGSAQQIEAAILINGSAEAGRFSIIEESYPTGRRYIHPDFS